MLPDTDELAFTKDFSTGVGLVVPDLIERADLVLTLGCKFTHNGSGGGELSLPEAKHVRVDASPEVLSANYPASLVVEGRVEDVLSALASSSLPVSHWRSEDLRALRARLAAESAVPIPLEPTLPDLRGGSIRTFFDALAEAAGERGVYVADAGLHQALTRQYARVLRPRGLLCPSDFQSMGFGLPGAIGAAIAEPQAQVVACIGDGGLVLSMGDLLTAAREGVSLVVVVFNDGQMNLIRRQQLTNYGHESGVAVANPDYAALAQAIGCSYFPRSRRSARARPAGLRRGRSPAGRAATGRSPLARVATPASRGPRGPARAAAERCRAEPQAPARAALSSRRSRRTRYHGRENA